MLRYLIDDTDVIQCLKEDLTGICSSLHLIKTEFIINLRQLKVII